MLRNQVNEVRKAGTPSNSNASNFLIVSKVFIQADFE